MLSSAIHNSPPKAIYPYLLLRGKATNITKQFSFRICFMASPTRGSVQCGQFDPEQQLIFTPDLVAFIKGRLFLSCTEKQSNSCNLLWLYLESNC